MTKKAKQPSGKPVRCPYCGSTKLYYRKRTDDFRCKNCGEDFVITV